MGVLVATVSVLGGGGVGGGCVSQLCLARVPRVGKGEAGMVKHGLAAEHHGIYIPHWLIAAAGEMTET